MEIPRGKERLDKCVNGVERKNGRDLEGCALSMCVRACVRVNACSSFMRR